MFVPERSARSLAIFDLESRRVLPERLKRIGATDAASLAFSPDLERGYVLSSDGKLSEFELATLRVTRSLRLEANARELTLSRDGTTLALADHDGRMLVLVDIRTLSVQARIPTADATVVRILALPEQFACVLAGPARVWLLERRPADAAFTVISMLNAPEDPRDALLTGDDHQLLLAHGPDFSRLSVLELARHEAGFRRLELEPARSQERPTDATQSATWAWVAGKLFVTQPRSKRLAVLDPGRLRRIASLALPGTPGSLAHSPSGRELWLTLDEAGARSRVQVIDAHTLALGRSFELPARVAHISFASYGPFALASAERDDEILLIHTRSHALLARESLRAPARAQGPWRALRAEL
jgi:hypothetical protein